jgi:uncharacterized membrane protein
MPDIGVFHPQVVHFAVALLFAGVVARWVSLTGKLPWIGPGATALLLAGTIAAVAAVKSGEDAHGPVERVPGARPAVIAHEDWGKRARNLFLAVAGLEIVALALGGRPGVRRGLLVASGVVGLAGGVALFEAAEHGGEVVYSYAGGVGIRSGDPEDVSRLLVAGLYHQARQDRAAGRFAEAARLTDELARRRPDDHDVRLLVVQSLIEDRKDGRAALAALDAMSVPDTLTRLVVRVGLLRADAYAALGLSDSARLTLQALAERFPESPAVRARLEPRP